MINQGVSSNPSSQTIRMSNVSIGVNNDNIDNNLSIGEMNFGGGAKIVNPTLPRNECYSSATVLNKTPNQVNLKNDYISEKPTQLAKSGDSLSAFGGSNNNTTGGFNPDDKKASQREYDTVVKGNTPTPGYPGQHSSQQLALPPNKRRVSKPISTSMMRNQLLERTKDEGKPKEFFASSSSQRMNSREEFKSGGTAAFIKGMEDKHESDGKRNGNDQPKSFSFMEGSIKGSGGKVDSDM